MKTKLKLMIMMLLVMLGIMTTVSLAAIEIDYTIVPKEISVTCSGQFFTVIFTPGESWLQAEKVPMARIKGKSAFKKLIRLFINSSVKKKKHHIEKNNRIM